MPINPQFTAPAGAKRLTNSTKDEHRREELRLNRRAKVKKPERKSYYERQLEKFGVGE